MTSMEEQLREEVESAIMHCVELSIVGDPERELTNASDIIMSLLSQHTQRATTQLVIGGKKVEFTHTAINKDAHLFIDGDYDPDVCPECIHPGILSFGTKDSTNKEEA